MNSKKKEINKEQESCKKWELRYSETVLKELKELKKLDKKNPQLVEEIKDYMEEVKNLKDPCSRGKPLTANLNKLWRYRVRDYRIICSINKKDILITALHIDHRSDVYN